MGTGDIQTITLTGGGPWGFRLIGGEGYPLQIAKVRKRSKAHSNGLAEGDTLISINGVSMSGKSHQEAMYEVDNAGGTLTIQVSKDPSQKVLQVVQENIPSMTNGGIHEPTVLQGPSTITSRTKTDGYVTTRVTTQKQTTDDGYSTKVFVQQQRVATNVVPTEKQWKSVQFKHQVPEAPKPCITPVKMFNVKNVVQESYKENVTPPAFTPSPVTPGPASITFKVRDIKGTMGRGRRAMSQPPQVMQQPSYLQPAQSVPRHMTPEPSPVAPPPPPPPPPPPGSLFKAQTRPVPDGSKPFPSDEPLMFPLPQVPYVSPDQVDGYPGLEYEDDIEKVERNYDHLPIFAPKVEIHSENPRHLAQMYVESSQHPDLLPLDLTRTASLESGDYSEPGTPDTGSTATRRKKNIYSDSAFYDAPGASYPTIQQQVILCKKIAQSLTSAANRKARGAKMFAKRKFKSSRWIHDGESHHEYILQGDIADLRDLDSEISVEDGGYKPLFSFRIPNIKNRFGTTDNDNLKMSISQDEFEALRLQRKKCDHRTVSPSTCHSLVADLSSPRNKGAKLFQKRQARSDKWVIDETNAKKPMMPPDQLNALLAQTTPKPQTPWEQALGNEGRVGQTFDQIDNRSPVSHQSNYMPTPPPTKTLPHHDLRYEGHSNVVVNTGPNFNRTPKGWGNGPVSYPPNLSLPDANVQQPPRPSMKQELPPPPPPKPPKQQDNYNRKIKAWNTDNQMGTNAERFRGPGGNMGPQQGFQANHQYHHMASNMLPATDL